MTSLASSPDRSASTRQRIFDIGRIPIWAVAVTCAAIVLAFSPNIVQIYGIHNDYEMLNFRSRSFLHPEAESLFAIARPVAALLTNLPMLPVDSLLDFRWTRIFSILTICFLSCQMIAICIHQIRMKVQDSVAVSLATFLVLPFIYSALNATAWPPHLLTIGLALVAYRILSTSNILVLSMLDLGGRRDHGVLMRQACAYVGLRPVWMAVVVYQMALYDYPPNALILTLLPVVTILFSRTPLLYRAAIAVRDTVFIGGNIVFFSLTAKLIYLPFVRLFTSLGTGVATSSDLNSLSARLTATYHFDFNADPWAAWDRLCNLLRVTGNVWFLPQAEMHVVVCIAIVLAFVLAQIVALAGRERRDVLGQEVQAPSLARLTIWSWSLPAIVSVVMLPICFLVAGSAVLASATGFVTYRTVTVPTAIVAIVLLFSARGIVELAWRAIGNPWAASGIVADAAMSLVVCAALAGNFYVNDLTMRLARNEFFYFSGIIRQAVENKSTNIVIIDPRPFMLPEDIGVVYDQHGRAVPPYELGCFSGYCMQSGSIVEIVAREMGYPPHKFDFYSVRAGDPIPGLTCGMLTSTQSLPPGLTEKQAWTVRWFWTLAPLTCVTYSLEWHDVEADLRR
jgi:hypothetical protein